MKKVAIVQSNYIPWKGYFDLIACVDEFILYDDVQFTKNDWRNRNRIKTPKGLEWLSIPVGQNISRQIREVTLPDRPWGPSHWKALETNYRRAPCFAWAAHAIQPLYLERHDSHLSVLNRVFIEEICRLLGIRTKITYSWDYRSGEGRVARLVDLCEQAGAAVYLTGASARGYLETAAFAARGISVEWFAYAGYPEYPQLWDGFRHDVTVLDLLFNTGPDASQFMKFRDWVAVSSAPGGSRRNDQVEQAVNALNPRLAQVGSK